jgi:hypothetical protein
MAVNKPARKGAVKSARSSRPPCRCDDQDEAQHGLGRVHGCEEGREKTKVAKNFKGARREK